MRLRNLIVAASLVAAANPALAHHVMDGAMPSTLMDGVASGLGHPIIGLDHLAAIIAAGAIAAVTGAGAALPAGFVIASLVGVGLHLALVDIPVAELMVAASVIGLGIALVARAQARPLLLGGFILAGLAHGYAYGESIVGAETSPLAGYFMGLLIVQAGVSTAAWAAFRRLPGLIQPAGFAVVLVGLTSMGLAVAS